MLASIVQKLRVLRSFALLPLLWLPAVSGQQDPGTACPQDIRYTFSWSLASDCAFSPRGGTSKGAPLTLAPDPHPGWLALQEPGLDKLELDRLAILAMAGPYRTSFEFLETVGYTPEFERARPYQSWGTEYIYVVEERSDFISLQHIMVMFMADDAGNVQGPFVQKHWRQDWQYQKPDLLVYAGNNMWKQQAQGAGQIDGSWAQSVYQVDDSPRYEASGIWEHLPNLSTWRSNLTWRPLPRRESSVRDDYQVLEGYNRHSITPTGWVHEEENYKVKLDAQGQRSTDLPYLAKELGVNRYDRIVDFDFSAGDAYWQQTEDFWADVRRVWQSFFDQRDQLVIVEEADGVPLFAALFEQAEQLTAEGRYDSTRGTELIRNILDRYID